MAGPLAGLSAGLSSVGAGFGGLGFTGGDLLSGALSFFGGRSSAKSAKRQANRALDLQEMQLRHGHELAVKDMREAGLNPILAAGNPAASSFSAGPVPQDTITPAVSTAIQSRMAREEIKNMEQERDTKFAAAQRDKQAGDLAGQQSITEQKTREELLPLQKQILTANASTALSNAKIAKTDEEWRETDKQVGAVSSVVGSIAEAIGAGNSAKSLLGKSLMPKPRNYTKTTTRGDSLPSVDKFEFE